MSIRINTLWKVPAFCVVAGFFTYSMAFYGLRKLAIVSLPDGSVAMDDTRVLLLYGALFVGTVLLGGLVFFRHMTRKELLLSASIVALYRVVLLLVQWSLRDTAGPSTIWMLYLLRPFEWCSFLSQVGFMVRNAHWISIILEVLSPYLFVSFGKKEEAT